VEKKDISVMLANGVPTIKGESENFHVSERSYGSFERPLRLPDTIDDAKVGGRQDGAQD